MPRTGFVFKQFCSTLFCTNLANITAQKMKFSIKDFLIRDKDIQSKCGKMRTQNNSEYGHFSRSNRRPEKEISRLSKQLDF